MLASASVAANLSGCATTSDPKPDKGPVSERAKEARLPTQYYPLEAQSRTDSVHLKVNPNGFSQNQITALNQVAMSASWQNDQPISVEVVTAESPQAVAAGEAVVNYLINAHVYPKDIVHNSQSDQPEDIVSINTVLYRAHVYDCNRSWENLTKTASNDVYDNFGCAISANLAAQVADPRDLAGPRPTTSTDATRKSVILDKYRTGQVTSAEKDDKANGTISNAVK
jgi:pilus assembly protein CpaD